MKRPKSLYRQLARLAAVMVLASAEIRAQQATTPDRRIVVSIPDRKLVLLEGDCVLKVYDTAVGKLSTPSPAGEFKVITRVTNPTWYTKGKTVPAGKSNPLGTRWIGLSVKGYGIHGTNAPKSIGKAASHGCIRMRNRDVEELFELVEVGIPVELRSEQKELVASALPVPEPGESGKKAGTD